MKQSIEKFLEFKGKTLIFISKNGLNWVAVKPVIEALGINYIRTLRNLKDDHILGPELSKQAIQVPGNDQQRAMICLPEEYIYGWIFSLRSDSEGLLEYKMECYHVLFEYFHGTITQRKKLFEEKALTRIERARLETILKADPNFIRLEEIRAKETRIGKELKEIDTSELNEQLDLFDNDSN